MTGELLIASALLLAFVNGANDNMKGVATLYGSGVLSYRKALALATGSTALGSLASVFLAAALVRAFSAKGLVPDAALTPEFLCAVGLGAGLMVLLATLVGAPISTTHALLGALFGAGWAAAGADLNAGALGAGAAMALGGLVAAKRVGETMAKKITPMTPEQGLGGNLATSFLVIVASRMGLPVSTTHVSTGAIGGIGATAGTLHRRTAARVLGAWLLTLPLAAALSALIMGLQSWK